MGYFRIFYINWTFYRHVPYLIHQKISMYKKSNVKNKSDRTKKLELGPDCLGLRKEIIYANFVSLINKDTSVISAQTEV